MVDHRVEIDFFRIWWCLFRACCFKKRVCLSLKRNEAQVQHTQCTHHIHHQQGNRRQNFFLPPLFCVCAVVVIVEERGPLMSVLKLLICNGGGRQAISSQWSQAMEKTKKRSHTNTFIYIGNVIIASQSSASLSPSHNGEK